MATASPQYAADPNLKKLLVNQQLGAGGMAPTDYGNNTAGPTKQPPVVDYPLPGPTPTPMTDYGVMPGPTPTPMTDPGTSYLPPAPTPMTDPGTPDPNVADGHGLGPMYGTAPEPWAAGSTPDPNISALGVTSNLGAPPPRVPAPPPDTRQPQPVPVPTTTTPPAATPPPAAAAQDWSTGDWDAARVNAYFASRNVTPQPGSAEYWAQKWQEFGKNDPAYFLRRLSTADEFTGGGGGGGGAPAYPTAPTSPFTDEIRKILLDRIAKDSAEFDPNSPQISVPMAGAQLQQDRAQEQQRRQLGERLFAGGDLNSGTMGQQNQQASEIGAAALGTMRGTLISKEIDARRTDLTNLLQMAVQSGDADLARQVSLAIANLNAMVAREGQGWAAQEFAVGQRAAPVKAVTGGG